MCYRYRVHTFVTYRDINCSVCVRACVRACVRVCVNTSEQNDSLHYTWWQTAHVLCTYVYASLCGWSIGRSVGVCWPTSEKKSLSFPHNQGAASHTSVRLLLYTLSWNLQSTNNSPVRPKKTLAERILKNDSTVSSSSPSSFFLCSCLLLRKLIYRCKPRCVCENQNCRFQKTCLAYLRDFSYTGWKTTVMNLQLWIFSIAK